ncbi:MAG: hydrolase [Epsilonproteobacteria bacterium]|nr:hydrolase [Campylobacterota bacterium]
MFNPPFYLQNKHIQTLFPTVFKKNPLVDFEQEIFVLSDGDFLEPFWLNKDLSKPIVILLHGLGGSYRSPYIPSLMQALSQNGFSPVLMHFRGCGTKPNNTKRSYHSGDTQDLREFLESLHVKQKELYAIGFSLGANVLLKYLGEEKEHSLISKAVAVSTPFKLDICADEINKGFSKIYQNHLLKDLKPLLAQKAKQFDIGLSQQQIQNIRTFWEFDELYTAPIHGFKDVYDYYNRSSSFGYLRSIQTKTLLIHAQDDPFMNKNVIPTKNDLSPTTTLELNRYGGHVGFIEGNFQKPIYWIDKRVVAYLKEDEPLLN